jgi:TolA-binding protein
MTLIVIAFVIGNESFAATTNFEQKKNKTHLRWNIFTEKPNLIIEKRTDKIILKTLDKGFFASLEQSLADVKRNNSYIKTIKKLKRNRLSGAYEVEVVLANREIEVFNFYRDRDRKHVIDFWTDPSKENTSIVSEADLKVNLKAPVKEIKKPKITKVLKRKVKKSKKITIAKKKDNGYRDFRYGASFVWDYKSLSPTYSEFVNIERKTPEFFYPIKNVNYKKGDKEAHLQLAINYYRKKKYGLMFKAFTLYQKKYGQDANNDMIEYIKANAIIRDYIDGKGKKTFKMAISMLDTISEKTQNYELKKAIYKYLLSYSLKSKEYVKGLNIAKKFYVNSKNNFDYEESQVALEAILYNLSNLNQVKRLQELITDKTIVKIMPKQKLFAYELYVHHKMGNIEEVIKIFEKRSKKITKPYFESIQFNVAESYFRTGNYKKAIKMFDEFVTTYSFHTRSSDARLRIALSYDLLDQDINKVGLLYLSAINRSQSQDISTEARIRYVALKSVRKKLITKSDLEKRVFLEFSEKIKLSKNLKKLLWQTRLRSYIVDKKYKQALSYLSALPLSTLTKIERRTFEADGAEVVYGKIFQSYKESDYPGVVKIWNLYKRKYVKKVANDSYVNFIVGRSYLKIGLYDALTKLIGKNSKSNVDHTFPHWIERSNFKGRSLMEELGIIKNIKLKNNKLAIKQIKKLGKDKGKRVISNYYSGIANFQSGNYEKAIKSFERYFSMQDRPVLFDPIDLSNVMNMYTESLYKLNKYNKFQKVSKAILSDTKGYMSSNDLVKGTRERLLYLTLEIDAGSTKTEDKLLLESRLGSFMKAYPKSLYRDRINYLLGRTYIENKKVKEAKDVFQKLLSAEEVGSSIKELVRSELSLLTIKEQTL